MLRRKTCALLRAKTSALLRRKTCAVLRARTCALFRANTKVAAFGRHHKGGRPSAAPLCGILCIGSEQSTCPSSQHSTCLASQQGRCLGSQQGTCLASQHLDLPQCSKPILQVFSNPEVHFWAGKKAPAGIVFLSIWSWKNKRMPCLQAT